MEAMEVDNLPLPPPTITTTEVPTTTTTMSEKPPPPPPEKGHPSEAGKETKAKYSAREQIKARHKVTEERKRQREQEKLEKEAKERQKDEEKAKRRKVREQARKVEEDQVTKEYTQAHERWEASRKRIKDVKFALKDLKRREAQLMKEQESFEKAPMEALIDPMTHGRLPFPTKLFSWATTAWYVANAFGDQLNLHSFTIDHFANALNSSEPSILLIETVRRLLRCALADGDVAVLVIEAPSPAKGSDDGLLGAGNRKKRKRKSSISGEQVTPLTWENSVARSLGGICDKLFGLGGLVEEDDDDDDDNEEDRGNSLEATARDAQLQLLGRTSLLDDDAPAAAAEKKTKPKKKKIKTKPLTEDEDDDDDDDDEKNESEEEDDDEDDSDYEDSEDDGKTKAKQFVDLELEQKVAAVAVLALGALASRKLRKEVDDRKFLQEEAAKMRKESLKEARAQDRVDLQEARDAVMAELRAERGLPDEDDNDDDEAAPNSSKSKAPTLNEVLKRLEQNKDAAILEHRTEISKIPSLEQIDDDEEVPEAELQSEEEENETKTARYFELRREIDGIKQRNAKRQASREKRGAILAERDDVLKKLAEFIQRDLSSSKEQQKKQTSAGPEEPLLEKSSLSLATELKALIKRGRKCLLLGDSGDCGRSKPWITKDMADALRYLDKLEKQAEVEKAAANYRAKLASFEVRREPLGYDRHGRAYWWLDDWATSVHRIPGYSSAAKFARVFRQTFATTDARLDGDNRNVDWACFIGRADLMDLYSSLSDAVEPERDLKHRIAFTFEHVLNDKNDDEKQTTQLLKDRKPPKKSDDDEPEDKTSEDPPKADEKEEKHRGDDTDDENWLRTGNDFIGRMIIRKFNRNYTEGVVVAYLPPTAEDPAIWRVEHADGDEEDLEESELLQAIADHTDAFKKYANARTTRNVFITDYLSGTHTIQIKKALVDHGYSSAQILDYLNNVD